MKTTANAGNENKLTGANGRIERRKSTRNFPLWKCFHSVNCTFAAFDRVCIHKLNEPQYLLLLLMLLRFEMATQTHICTSISMCISLCIGCCCGLSADFNSWTQWANWIRDVRPRMLFSHIYNCAKCQNHRIFYSFVGISVLLSSSHTHTKGMVLFFSLV